MRGDPEVIEALNAILTSELTAINQYFIHYKMAADWGYSNIAEKKRAESMEEMHHADMVIDRILFLDGIPNMQRYNPVRVGETVPEMHQVDLDMELVVQRTLNEAIALCVSKGDNGSRELVEKLLEGTEDGIDWLEAQLQQIEDMGAQNYLAAQV